MFIKNIMINWTELKKKNFFAKVWLFYCLYVIESMIIMICDYICWNIFDKLGNKGKGNTGILRWVYSQQVSQMCLQED